MGSWAWSGSRARGRAGEARARGPNARWKVPRQGCREGVCGRWAFTRNSWLGAACRGIERHRAHSLDRDRTQSERTKRARGIRDLLYSEKRARALPSAQKGHTRAHRNERSGTHQTVSAVSFVEVPHASLSVFFQDGSLRQPRRAPARHSRIEAIVAIRVACVLGDRTTEICTP